ncbi:MAG TPA: aspartate/glutamate racemase family protein [Caulobacterales bacterium]|nr:aspartate/glutamate racemase family protein [Caulobacterales bacterium]
MPISESPLQLLGLIGGMSWESTTHYYQVLNRMTRERLGGRHSARLLLWSVDFAPVAEKQEAGQWDALAEELSEAARRLEGAGAEALVICANTMHLMADQVADAVSIPLIHIADATADAIKAADVERPLLLATRFTMERDFYRNRLAMNGVDALIPDEADRAELHRIIFDELVQGKFRKASRQKLLDMVEKEREARGIDGVILGCTEFGMLTPPDQYDVPAIDTALEHCKAAMDVALDG